MIRRSNIIGKLTLKVPEAEVMCMCNSILNLKSANLQSAGNVSTNVYAKFRYAPLRIKKALGIFRELITLQQQKEEQLEWLFGTRLPGPKYALSLMSIRDVFLIYRILCKVLRTPSVRFCGAFCLQMTITRVKF